MNVYGLHSPYQGSPPGRYPLYRTMVDGCFVVEVTTCHHEEGIPGQTDHISFFSLDLTRSHMPEKFLRKVSFRPRSKRRALQMG